MIAGRQAGGRWQCDLCVKALRSKQPSSLINSSIVLAKYSLFQIYILKAAPWHGGWNKTP